MMKLHFSSSR